MLLRAFIRQRARLSGALLASLKHREDGIQVNGERVTVRRILHTGDIVTLNFEDTAEAEKITPVDLPLSIVYEDADILVVNKPPFMPTHPSFRHPDDTLANAVAYYFAKQDRPCVFRPISRLDKNTSGLLLLAKDRVAAGILACAMRRGEIQKTYKALLDGKLPQRSGRLITGIRRAPDTIIVREVTPPGADGSDIAVTDYRVERGDRYTLVTASPLTGRTHQLRLHFAYLGAPILGDDLYGCESVKISRQALHAAELTFRHPKRGEVLSLSAPIPTDMASLLNE